MKELKPKVDRNWGGDERNKNDRNLTRFSSRPRAKRRLSLQRKVSWMHTTLALLLLVTTRSSGFVVSLGSKHPGASILRENELRENLLLLSCSTETEPDTWQKRPHQAESTAGSFHPGEHVFVMELDGDGDDLDIDSADDDEVEAGNNEAARGEADVDEEFLEKRRKAQVRAALLAKRGGARKSPSSKTPKQTSVGDRRVGSATLGRRGGSAASQIMDALRKTAQGTSSSPSSPKKNSDNTEEKNPPKTSARISQRLVHSAIEQILARDDDKLTAACRALGRNMGRLKEALVKDETSIRIATPDDDVDIANLRLSVFSDFTTDLQHHFCARSCQAIAARRLRGATCFVATAPCRDSVEGSRTDMILGSAECSFHEFFGTCLGRRRLPRSILYVTEVAVRSSARRRGIGAKLMAAILSLAQKRCIETLYLHCDVENHGALKLYEKSGYRQVLSDDPMYSEFTKSLNLHPGATKGREHFLLYKNVVSEPTWLKEAHQESQYSPTTKLTGVLGFEIPA